MQPACKFPLRTYKDTVDCHKNKKLFTFSLFFCRHPDASLNYQNVAPSGIATQSSTHSIGVASKAIDGNRNPNYFDGSCTHTYPGLTHWWSLLLPAVYRISSISITNRDHLPSRIDNSEILIGNSFENNGNNNPR